MGVDFVLGTVRVRLHDSQGTTLKNAKTIRKGTFGARPLANSVSNWLPLVAFDFAIRCMQKLPPPSRTAIRIESDRIERFNLLEIDCGYSVLFQRFDCYLSNYNAPNMSPFTCIATIALVLCQFYLANAQFGGHGFQSGSSGAGFASHSSSGFNRGGHFGGSHFGGGGGFGGGQFGGGHFGGGGHSSGFQSNTVIGGKTPTYVWFSEEKPTYREGI